jgi:ABC-2 type transport system ATP-binding protein
LTDIGVLLEARAVHTGRSARNHLRALAATHRIPRRRVEEVIGLVGLDSVAGKRAGGFSLGMGQRLGIAAALIGDPGVLLFDEPVNGLDPAGVRWIRQLLQSFAAEGRTVFVSSHLMSEMALTAAEVIVIGRGRLITSGPVDDVIRGAGGSAVFVRADEPARLATALTAAGHAVRMDGDGSMQVTGADGRAIGQVAARVGVTLVELTTKQPTLEEAFMQITRESVEYEGHTRSANTAGAQSEQLG